MKINTTFRHMEVDDELRDYVEEKIQKLADKYFHRPQDVNIVLDAEKFRRLAEIVIRADNSVFTGKEQKEDLRAAIDGALDKLEKQAEKHRKRYKKKRNNSEPEVSFAVYRGEEEVPRDEGDGPEIIKVDRFVPKPLSVEDAALVLEDLHDDFIVFRNSDTMNICVMFRRPDGNYGLIEPEN